MVVGKAHLFSQPGVGEVTHLEGDQAWGIQSVLKNVGSRLLLLLTK